MSGRSQLDLATAALLFTDIQGSTRFWEDDAVAMRAALAIHDLAVRRVLTDCSAVLIKALGDGFLAVFKDPVVAGLAAVDIQRTLQSASWPTAAPLQLRVGVHVGDVEWRDDDVHGVAVNRAARLMAAAHGGQVLISGDVARQLQAHLPDGVTLLDLGEHQLRDVGATWVFQIVADGLPASFQPLRSLELPPTNLPVPVTATIDRLPDLREVSNRLRRCRLMTLTGPAGVGKTRVAAVVGAAVTAHYPDGVWYCSLSGVPGGGGTVARTLAGAMRLTTGDVADPEDIVVNALREQRTLIVLDNCEHVISDVAGLVERIVSSSAAASVLATSREPLGIEGEHVWHVRPLAVPASPDVADLESADAVRLFLQRAQAQRPEFELTLDNAAAIAELCRRLDGLPLALELAAARTAVLSPEDLVRRLDDRFRVLGSSSHGRISHHRTLLDTIRWSYDALDDGERAAFNAFSVFAGSFELEAAEAVAVDAGDAMDAIAGLVAKSMLVAEPSNGTMRYRMLESIREFGRKQLEENGRSRDVHERHAHFYAGMIDSLILELSGPRELTAAARIADSVADLRAAVSWALDDSNPGLALRLFAGIPIRPFFSTVLGLEFGLWAEAALKVAGTERRPQFRDAVRWARHRGLEQQDIEALRALCAMAAQVHRERGEPESSALHLARCAVAILTNAEDVVHHCTNAVEAARLETPADLVETLSILSVFEHLGGDHQTAVAHAREAEGLARQLGAPSALSFALMVLAFVLGDATPEAALAAAQESADVGARSYSSWAAESAQAVVARIAVGPMDASALNAYASLIRDAWRKGLSSMLSVWLVFLTERLANWGHDEEAVELAASLTSTGLAEFMGTAKVADMLTEAEARLDPRNLAAARARGATRTDRAQVVDWSLGVLARFADDAPPPPSA